MYPNRNVWFEKKPSGNPAGSVSPENDLDAEAIEKDSFPLAFANCRTHDRTILRFAIVWILVTGCYEIIFFKIFFDVFFQCAQ
jgi:hypothetical protein